MTTQSDGEAYEEAQTHGRRSSFRMGGRDDYSNQVKFFKCLHPSHEGLANVCTHHMTVKHTHHEPVFHYVHGRQEEGTLS